MKFSNVEKYRINLYQTIVSLYTNKHREDDHGHTPIHNSLKEYELSRINLTTEVNDFNNETQPLKRERN